MATQQNFVFLIALIVITFLLPHTTAQFNCKFSYILNFCIWICMFVCVCLIYDKMPFTFFKRRIFFCTHIRFASVCVLYACVWRGVCVSECVWASDVCARMCICVWIFTFYYNLSQSLLCWFIFLLFFLHFFNEF